LQACQQVCHDSLITSDDEVNHTPTLADMVSVTLVSADEQRFDVDEKVAKMSKTISAAIEEDSTSSNLLLTVTTND